MLMRERATAIATRVMTDQPHRSGPFDYGATSALVHDAAVRVYEVMHEENERLLADCHNLLALKNREQAAKERLETSLIRLGRRLGDYSVEDIRAFLADLLGCKTEDL